MSEFPLTETFTIIGVIVGFFLSQSAILIKSFRSRRELKRALIIEMTIAKDSISYANSYKKMPKDKLPLITGVYDSSKPKLASIFNKEKISLVHMAYARIKQVGSPMNSGTTLFRGYVEPAGGDHVIYQHNLDEDVKFLDDIIEKLTNQKKKSKRNATQK